MSSTINRKPSVDLPPQFPVHTLTGVEILATGSYAPPHTVTNEDLADLGYDDEWILKRTGIRSRKRLDLEKSVSDIGYEAARLCLDRAGVAAGDLDLILVATMTPDQPTPSSACMIGRRLGCFAAAMDVNAACAGFMYGLITGMHFVKSGTFSRVLVVGADVMSRTVDPEDRKTFPLFGDGAGAVLLGPGAPDKGLLGFTLGADGRGENLLCTPVGGSREPVTRETLDSPRRFLQMQGRQVFRWAVRLITETAHEVLRHAELSPADLDWVVMHQANQRIIDSAAEDIGVPPNKVIVNVDRYGNTSAGSIPLVLDEAREAGKIQSGDKVLLTGFGAGLAWGSAVLNW